MMMQPINTNVTGKINDFVVSFNLMKKKNIAWKNFACEMDAICDANALTLANILLFPKTSSRDKYIGLRPKINGAFCCF